MELAGNPELVVPAMLVITASYVTAVQFFNTKSIFLQQLDFLQLPYKLAPADDVLQKVGVLAMVQKEYIMLDNPSDIAVLKALDDAGTAGAVVVRRHYAVDQQLELASYDVSLSLSGESVVRYQAIHTLQHQATMAEVFALLGEHRGGAVMIMSDEVADQPLGLVRWEQVRQLLMRQNNLL